MDPHKGFWILAAAITGTLLLEYFVSRKKGLRNFSFGQSVGNISNGIADRLFHVILIPLYYDVFQYVYVHWALFNLPVNAVTVVLLFLAIDFIWYWYHRLSHEISLLWCAHVVHHQSTKYNYTVALKITPFQAIVRYTMWAALPLAGFSPELTFMLIGINAVHQFLIHTELIVKLGWLEKILVTPSHHRVHHASNPAYLDRNYGGFLIIWDKLFGTFRKEEEPVRYGLTEPFQSTGFVHGYFHYWQKLWRTARRLHSWKQRLAVFFTSPGKLKPARDLVEAAPLPDSTWYVRAYTASVLVLCGVMLVYLSVCYERLWRQDLLFIYIFILLALTGIGALLEARKMAFRTELLKAALLFWICVVHHGAGNTALADKAVLLAAGILGAAGLAVTFHYCIFTPVAYKNR